jgi:hypothetical protein
MCRPIEWPEGGNDDPPDDVVMDIVEYGKAHPADWAEFWLWGDKVRIAFTRDLEGHERRLGRLLRDRHPFEVVEVAYSWRELKQIHADITEAMHNGDRIAGAKPQGVGTDAVHNIVTVMLDRVDDEVRRAMVRRFGSDKYCLEEGTVGPG